MWLTLSVLALGAVLALVASGRVWAAVELTGGLGQGTGSTVDVRGSDVVPVAPALSLVALAALLAVPATRRWGRRVVGGVLAATGAGLTGATLVTALDLRPRVVRWIDLGDVSGTLDSLAAHPWWPALTVLAGVAVMACGLAVLLRGPRWPAMGARYERPVRPSARNRSTTSEAVESSSAVERPAETWDALDRGEDPT